MVVNKLNKNLADTRENCAQAEDQTIYPAKHYLVAVLPDC